MSIKGDTITSMQVHIIHSTNMSVCCASGSGCSSKDIIEQSTLPSRHLVSREATIHKANDILGKSDKNCGEKGQKHK